MEVLIGGVSYVNTTACGRETAQLGKASHRGHRGPGMEVLIVGVLSVNGVGFRARKKPRLFFTAFPDRILWAPIPNPPSVTSVASVRCFPPLRSFLRPEATGLPIEFSGASIPNPPSVTSVASVRCFPPLRSFLRPEATVLPIEFSGASIQIPPS